MVESKRLAQFVVLAASALLLPAPSLATAIVIDAAGDSGEIAGVYYTGVLPPDSSGTGRFDPFVRIQQGGTDPQTQAGYNTEGTLELQTKSGPWTHAILLGDVPTVSFAGVSYYEFLFDSNEPGGARSAILIDEIQIFVADAPDLTGYDPAADLLAGLSAVYRLDDGDDHTIVLNANFSGSGRGELQMLLPVDLVGGELSQYLYFYSEYSQAGGGFEEWAVRVDGTPSQPPTSVPEPQELLLVLAGLGGLAFQSRRHKLEAWRA